MPENGPRVDSVHMHGPMHSQVGIRLLKEYHDTESRPREAIF